MIKRVVLALCLMAPPVFAEPLVLNWPIECRINQTCFIQQYMDLDESDGVRDYASGQMANDGHKGTDIRLTSQKTMHEGVTVLASSAGQVLLAGVLGACLITVKILHKK